MKYKKTYYQVTQFVAPNIYLCTNFNNDSHILLSEDVYNFYIDEDEYNGLRQLKDRYPKVFCRLLSNGFIIDAMTNETALIYKNRNEAVNDKQLYHIVVNPTLDCNLSCWYCYESRVPKSAMSIAVADAVLKNIAQHYKESPYSQLKLSFFGGEPFLRPVIIKHIITGADLFCKKNNIRLLLDFTTNGTLCSNSMVSFLMDYTCMFQISLDGNREQHNKVKFTKSKGLDTFTLTLKNIDNIQKRINKCHVSVRINFDKHTLEYFDEILEELKKLDRTKTKIILKRIWQVDSEEIDKSLIYDTLTKLFNNRFVVDYYSQGGICFADRNNQILINFDGNIFKCTTICNFDGNNKLGYIDMDTGVINWDEKRIEYLHHDCVAAICKNCRMLPTCGGFCKKKIAEKDDVTCFLTTCNLSMEEYALTQFKINLIKQQYAKSK